MPLAKRENALRERFDTIARPGSGNAESSAPANPPPADKQRRFLEQVGRDLDFVEPEAVPR